MTNITNFVKRIRDIMRNDAGINGDAQRIEQLAWLLFLKVYDSKEQDWEIVEDNYVSIIPENCRWANWAHDDKSGDAMTGDTLLDFVDNTLFPTLKGLNVTPETPIKKSIVKTTFEDANQYMKDGVLLRQVVNIIDDLDLSDYDESHAFGEIYESILKELQSAGSAGEFYTPRAVTDFMAEMIKPEIGEQMADFACGTGGFITSWLKQLEKKVKTVEDQEAYSNSIYGVEKKQFPYMLCITNMLLHGIDVPRVYHDNSLLRDVLDYTERDQFDVILMNPPYGGSEKAEVKNHFPSDLASSETADLFMSVIMYRLKKGGRAAVILPDGFLFGLDNAKVNIKKKLLNEFDLHTVIRLPAGVFAPYTSITTNILFFNNTNPTENTWFYRLDPPKGLERFSKTRPFTSKHIQPAIDWWNNRVEEIVDEQPKAKMFSYKELTETLNYDLDQCGFFTDSENVKDLPDLLNELQKEKINLSESLDEIMLQLTNILGGISKLTPQDLKSSILQYAIQGKLVEQRAEEGSGEELYQQIQREKAKLVKEGKIKKEKPLPEITEDEIPFYIPESWKWVRIGEVFSLTLGQSPAGESVSEFCDGIEFHQGKINFGNKYLNVSSQKTIAPKRIAQPNSVLLCVRAPVGIVNITDREICIGRGLCAVHPLANMTVEFVYYLLATYEDIFIRHATGTTFVAITGEVVKNQVIPLPPLAEQKRIVAKIEEIFISIDKYAQAKERLKNLSEEMQKSLLQYAIQGKLVEQREEEGTGEELYQQIQKEKAKLVKEGKIKKEKPLPEITEDEIPFDIPESWKWVHLNQIAISELGKTLDKAKNTGDMCPYLCSINVLWSGINLDIVKKARFTEDDKKKYLLQKGDLLICEGGEIGRSAIWKKDIEMYYQNALHRVRFYGELEPYYFKYLLEFYKAAGILNKYSKGMTIKHLVQKALYSMWLPLPPLAEQKRIVARLEELLPLCEKLK